MRPTAGPRLNVGWRKPPPANARPTVPAIGPWQLVRQVHEGPMFRVHQVRPLEQDAKSSAGYALKELLPRWDHVPAAVELLTREALVGRSVSHPHLVAVLSSQMATAPRYAVMPWLQGDNLATIVRQGRLRIPRAIWIVRQVAEALDALHAAGWLHGDIKPDNIMVGDLGHTTLIDLGFARQCGERITSFNDCLRFTAAYAAPEVVSTHEVDGRSDLYSLGVTFYELLTGHAPFFAPSVEEMIRKHREERPRDLRLIASDVPSEVSRLVHQLLSKDPLRRPQTARELIDRLVELEIALFDFR